jgi:alcohol dehydrogenase class IV
MTITRFSFPTAIHFGPGASRLVGDHLREQGLRRPLVVTDKGLTALPVLRNFLATLAGLDAALYAGVHGNPTASQVMAGRDAFRTTAPIR